MYWQSGNRVPLWEAKPRQRGLARFVVVVACLFPNCQTETMFVCWPGLADSSSAEAATNLARCFFITITICAINNFFWPLNSLEAPHICTIMNFLHTSAPSNWPHSLGFKSSICLSLFLSLPLSFSLSLHHLFLLDLTSTWPTKAVNFMASATILMFLSIHPAIHPSTYLSSHFYLPNYSCG